MQSSLTIPWYFGDNFLKRTPIHAPLILNESRLVYIVLQAGSQLKTSREKKERKNKDYACCPENPRMFHGLLHQLFSTF